MNHNHPNLTLASHFLLMGRPERALDYLQNASAETRETVRYWQLQSNAYYQQKTYSKALSASKAGLAAYPEDVELMQTLARVYSAQSAYDSAETTLTNALQRHPENASLYYQASLNDIWQNKLDSAETLLESGRSLAPASTNVPRLYAELAIRRRQWDSAETHVRDMLKLNPEDSYAYQLLAQIYFKTSRQIEAEDQLKRAATLNPTGSAVTQLRAHQTGKANLGKYLFYFSSATFFIATIIGFMTYFRENDPTGLICGAGSLPLAILFLVGIRLSQTEVVLGSDTLILSYKNQEKVIAFSDIVDARTQLFGFIVETTSGNVRIYRLSQVEQSALLIKLRNTIPNLEAALAKRLETPLPFTVGGNKLGIGLAGICFLGGLVLLYGGFTVKDDGLTPIFILGSLGLFMMLGAGWWLSDAPLWWRFSAETIKIRHLFHTKTVDAAKIEYVRLQRHFIVYKGNQLPKYVVEIHLNDGEIVKLSQEHIQRPIDDWSPLHELTSRLQLHYNVSAPKI